MSHQPNAARAPQALRAPASGAMTSGRSSRGGPPRRLLPPSRAATATLVLAASLGTACGPPAADLERSAPQPGVMTGEADASHLRVCADPNNMPYSNERGEGFENRLAEMVAADLGRMVQYTWWAQRRGFIRNTLNAGTCDVVMGVPADYELTRTTRPYYRSTYVYVTRADEAWHLDSFDDPILGEIRIGVHVVGDDYANVPPAQALANRGIVRNIRGYTLFGDYSRPSPPADLIAAVGRGEIDMAFAWGPLAGYFGPRQPVPLAVGPVPQEDGPGIAFAFEISMGVRKEDDVLWQELERIIDRRGDAIAGLLQEYGVPLLPLDR